MTGTLLLKVIPNKTCFMEAFENVIKHLFNAYKLGETKFPNLGGIHRVVKVIALRVFTPV